jgi:hypothetical protein
MLSPMPGTFGREQDAHWRGADRDVCTHAFGFPTESYDLRIITWPGSISNRAYDNCIWAIVTAGRPRRGTSR